MTETSDDVSTEAASTGWYGRTGLVGRLIVVVLVAAVFAFLLRGASRPADPSLAAVEREPLRGFGDVAFTVTGPGGRIDEWCALLADTEATRSVGLMDQDDLRGYDGMVFRWASPTSGRFYMFHTRIPLSIAWFDAQGAYVSEADMAPCTSQDPGACEQYPAAAPYLHALEVPRGGLRRLGVVPGATLAFSGGGCRR